MMRPMNATAVPIAIDDPVGCASQMYAAANRNPNGTRMRRAMWFQLRTRFLQQFMHGGYDFIGRDVHQAGIGSAGVRKRSLACRIAEHNAFRSVRPVTRGIGGAEDG